MWNSMPLRVNHFGPSTGSRGAVYCLRDRLHDGRTIVVPGERIASVVSAWLSELGAVSPLVDEFATAVCDGNWPDAYALSDSLAVEVSVAEAAS